MNFIYLNAIKFKRESMEFAISLLQEHQKAINRNVKSTDLMQKDISLASRELAKVSELKRAIKILKFNKNK